MIKYLIFSLLFLAGCANKSSAISNRANNQNIYYQRSINKTQTSKENKIIGALIY